MKASKRHIFIYYYYYYLAARVDGPNPGTEPVHSSNLSCCRDNAESLSRCTQRELLIH